jgi:sigma-B regulation protein RsbU (phosphoserine phosphatase)
LEVIMPAMEMEFLQAEVTERKLRLEAAVALVPHDQNLKSLLREVDSTLERMADGTYGLCEVCHDPIEKDRLLANPLVRYCLDHLNKSERDALQRDLDLATQLQSKLLPPSKLCACGWDTCHHYAPLGAVSGDYCDLIEHNGSLFFFLGDVSGKGISASLLMTQIHTLFRNFLTMGIPLSLVVAHVNRSICEKVLTGHYVTIVCGQANPNGEVEIYNAGHPPVIVTNRDDVLLLESTGVPLGLFQEANPSPTKLQLHTGDTIFLYTDGLSEACCQDDEYGVDRLTALMGKHRSLSPTELVSVCLKDLAEFTGATPRTDDLTLLALQHTGAA